MRVVEVTCASLALRAAAAHSIRFELRYAADRLRNQLDDRFYSGAQKIDNLKSFLLSAPVRAASFLNWRISGPVLVAGIPCRAELAALIQSRSFGEYLDSA